MKSIKEQLTTWQEKMDDFQAQVSDELNQIHQFKQDIAELQAKIVDTLGSGQYIRNESRIILSAPEIIIGDVNKLGLLNDNDSCVIIRSKRVEEEAENQISQRAPKIHQIAERAGKDGAEHLTLFGQSEIVSVARNVLIQSHTDSGLLPQGDEIQTEPGISLLANKPIRLESSHSYDKRKEQLEQKIAALEDRQNDLEQKTETQKNTVKNLMDEIESILNVPSFNLSDLFTRANYMDLDEQQTKFNEKATEGYEALLLYFHYLSELAEVKRELAIRNRLKDQIDQQKTDVEDQPDATAIRINAEVVEVTNRDGDGADRAETGQVSIKSPLIQLQGIDKEEKKFENGQISIQSDLIQLQTDKIEKDKESGDVTLTSEGHVDIRSKTVTINALDSEEKGEETTEKALADGSCFFVRTQNMLLNAMDQEGKSQGNAIINAKNIRIMSTDMDIQDDKCQPKNVAEGSKLQLEAESMYVGRVKEKFTSKLVQVAATDLKLYGKDSAELQQDDDKGLIQLKDAKVAVNGKEVELFGKMKSNGESTFTSLVSDHISADTMEVKSGWKTPKTSEGMPGSASPDTSEKKSEKELEEPEFDE